ncbi:MAG: hypothetical protein KGI25_03915 [Thaumarchaeota archaeon]|nr:hypothetical protein [Nitrososphaerota archaeon]
MGKKGISTHKNGENIARIKKCHFLQESMENRVTDDVLGLFFDQFKRPHKTPLHMSAIQRRLEDKHSFWVVSDALKKLVEDNILMTEARDTNNSSSVHFYYPTNLDISPTEMSSKIKNIVTQIDRYSSPRNTSVLGNYLHALVRRELKVHRFKIIDENTNSYGDKKGEDGKQDLDIIAEHEIKGIKVGVEIKNTLDVIEKEEILSKTQLCKDLRLIPIFACRWLEPYKEEIRSKGGFPWQFKWQIYPIGREKRVNEIRRRFGFPVAVMSEIPEESVKEFETWIASFNQ